MTVKKTKLNSGQAEDIIKQDHIDQLRGVAIILVVITHVALFQGGISDTSRNVIMLGRIGVQLFFFLSAYTLCLSMSLRREDHSIRNFYARRYFRIAPLYYTGIVFYFILTQHPALNAFGIAHSVYTVKNVLANVFFVHSFFPSAFNLIVPGGWSIGTEMAFYAIFPIIFMVFSRIKSKALFYTLPFLALCLAGIYVLILHLFGKKNISFFFYAFILNQLPVFIIGMSYYFLEKFGAIKTTLYQSLIGFIVLFVVAMFLLYDVNSNITIPIFIAAISFGFLFSVFKLLNVKMKLLKRIGQLSFSIYLFHFSFVHLFPYKSQGAAPDSLSAYMSLVINVVLALIATTLVALVSEKLIEKPGITLGKRVTSKSKTVPASTQAI